MTALLTTTAVMLCLLMVIGSTRGSTECPYGCWCNAGYKKGFKVECSGQSITTVPLISLRNVTKLVLSENIIRLIEKDSFITMTELEVLIIEDCGVRRIALGAFNGLTKLRELDITGNMLSEPTSGTFGNLRNLESLTLSYNGFKHLDSDVFSGLYNLKDINLMGNDLQYLHPDTFLGLPNIRSVVLNVNPHLQIPIDRSFINSNSLSRLYISHCDIRSLSVKTFAKVSGLEWLDLIHNELRNIEIGILKALPKLSVLKLYGNPLHCDCKLKKVWRWCEDHAISSDESDLTPYCDTPIEMQGRLWDVLRDMECLKDNEKHNGGCNSTNCINIDSNVTGMGTERVTDTQTDTDMGTERVTDTQTDTDMGTEQNGKVSSSLTKYQVAVYAVFLIFYLNGLL